MQQNVQKFLRSLSEWSGAPMYKRIDGNKNLYLDILQADNQIKMRNEKVEITKELIQRSMHENFKLFFNIAPDSDGNDSHNKLSQCNHKFVIRRMESMRSIDKCCSEDIGLKVRLNHS